MTSEEKSVDYARRRVKETGCAYVVNSHGLDGDGPTSPYCRIINNATENGDYIVAPYKETAQPRRRLTKDGDTMKGGSPSRLMVKIDSRWYRIYDVGFYGTMLITIHKRSYSLRYLKNGCAHLTKVGV